MSVLTGVLPRAAEVRLSAGVQILLRSLEHAALHSSFHPALFLFAPELLIRRTLLIAALPGAPAILAIRTRLDGCKVMTSAKAANHFAAVGINKLHGLHRVPPACRAGTLLKWVRKPVLRTIAVSHVGSI